MAENTFLGLQPYTEADAYRFKGRTEESQELFRLIVRNDYTVCYAESGEGKTSLLNAGVFPLLRQNMFFPIAITFTIDDYNVTPDSFDTIIDRCIKDSIAEYNEKNNGVNIEYKLCSTDFQRLDSQAELYRELSKYSWWKLRNYKPQAMGLSFTPVFVFDQFEEVFNLPGSIVWTKKFFDWLEDVSSDSCPDEIAKKIRAIIGTNAAFPAIKEEKDFKAVFSLRKEFIGELDYWGMQKCFIPSLKDNRYCLKALTYKGAMNVMTQQKRFDETKVKQVLHYFVQQYSRESEKTIEENLPVIPALLLSVVCDSWEKDMDFFAGKNDSEIGQSLNIILERFYDEALSSITNELSQQEIISQVESICNDIDTTMFSLVDGNGKRVRRKTTELTGIEFDTKYKKALSKNRIIKITKVDGEDYVEIVHDALCSVIAHRKGIKLAEEAMRHEEQKMREVNLKRKMRFRLLSMIIFIWFTLLFCLYYFYQNHQLAAALHERELADSMKVLYGEFGLYFDPNISVKQKNTVINILSNMVVVRDRSLWISQFEFTVGQWYGILDKSYDESLKDMPMTNVSYGEVYMFISKLQDMTNVEFALPSVEEWEYAARAGDENALYAGSDDVKRVAWYKDNSGRRPHPSDGVQGKEPNMFDVYDMSGNVSELCNTPYDDQGRYTICGGNYDSPASEVTVSSREGFSPDKRSEKVGFRLVVRRTPIKEPCKQCNGTGMLEAGVCPACSGIGY